MPVPAVHAADIGSSGIRQIMGLVRALSDPVIGLHIGEPEETCLPHVAAALEAALRNGQTAYAPSRGLSGLIERISDKLAKENGITADHDDIVVTAGGTQAVHQSLAAVIDSGDEVLLPDPGWPNYKMMVRSLRGRAVPYPLRPENGYLPDPAEIDALVTPQTRAVIVNSPANPHGAVIPPSLGHRLVEVAERQDLWIVSDECYEHFVFDGVHSSIAALAPHRGISCFSFSKSYAMTGLRVGYLSAPRAVADTCVKLQESSVACVNTPAQWAAVAAIDGPHDRVREASERINRRRKMAARLLQNAGIPHVFPQGAFYLWLKTSRDRHVTDLDWAAQLLHASGVAVAPGSAFGDGGQQWARVTLAVPDHVLSEGLDRIVDFVRGEDAA
jgi:aspartate aminotransferase